MAELDLDTILSIANSGGGSSESTRPTDLFAHARSEAGRLGIDPDMAERLIKVESGGRSNAVSPKGAFGPAQLMPGTAADLRKRYPGFDPEDPYDNISLGLRYLKENLDAFGGDKRLAAAAYQAGPGAVRKAGGVPNTTDGITKTSNYSRMVGGDDSGDSPVTPIGMGETAPVTPKSTVSGLPQELQNYINAYGSDEAIEKNNAAVGKAIAEAAEAARVQSLRDAGPSLGDYGKAFGASLTQGVGDIAQAGGEVLAWFANKAGGTEDYEGFNPLRKAAESIRSGMGEAGKLARQDQPKGDLFAPETWQMPETAAGMLMLGAEGFGSLIPSMLPALGLAGRVSRGAKALEAAKVSGDAAKIAAATQELQAAQRLSMLGSAVSAGGMTGGAAANDARENVLRQIQGMSHDDLMAVPLYREAFAESGDEQTARRAVENGAAQYAGVLSGLAGAAGGAVSSKFIDDILVKQGVSKALGSLSGNAAVRAGAGAVGGATVEGLQEVTEGVGQAAGENLALGRPVGENVTRDSFGNFVGGALVGGPVGGVGGAVSPAPQPAPAPVRQPNSPLTNAANAAAAAAPTPMAPAQPIAGGPAPGAQAPAADPLAERIAALSTVLDNREWLRGLPAENRTELLNAFTLARNPTLDPNLRARALEGAEAFVQQQAKRPDWVFGQNDTPTEQPASAVVPFEQPAAPGPVDPTFGAIPGEATRIAGELPGQAHQVGAPPAALPSPIHSLPAPIAEARQRAEAEYEAAFQDLVKAEALKAGNEELQQKQRALQQANAMLDDIHTAIDGNRVMETARVRRQVLDGVLTNPDISNHYRNFGKALQAAGLDPNVMPEERDRILRFNEIVSAFRPQVEPAAPNEMDAGALGVRERGVRPTSAQRKETPETFQSPAPKESPLSKPAALPNLAAVDQAFSAGATQSGQKQLTLTDGSSVALTNAQQARWNKLLADQQKGRGNAESQVPARDGTSVQPAVPGNAQVDQQLAGVEARPVEPAAQAKDSVPVPGQPAPAGAIPSGAVANAQEQSTQPVAQEATAKPDMVPAQGQYEQPATDQRGEVVPDTQPEAPAVSERDQAWADLGQGIDELVSLLGGKVNMLPEEEARIIPVMSKIFRAAAKLGYLSFKDSARFVYSQIRGKSAEVADKLSIDNLQAGYINVAREIGGNKAEALKFDSIEELMAEPETMRERIEQAEARVDTAPTEAQIAADNYRKGSFAWNGLRIVVETPKGAERRGTDKNGKAWSITMPVLYGDIAGFKGADKDKVDLFMGPNPESPHVFVINQTQPDADKFDEHKTLAGFNDAEEAKAAYLASFSDNFGEKVFGSLAGPFSVDEFKALLPSLEKKSPVKQRLNWQTTDSVAASGYVLPQGDVNQDWRNTQDEPTKRQQLLIGAVEKALDDGLSYNREVDDFVAKELGVGPEIRAINNSRVDGGDFGYDVYLARKHVERVRENTAEQEARVRLNLKAGDEIGTFVLNDGKTYRKAVVLSADGPLMIEATLGSRRVQFPQGLPALSIERGIKRAEQEGVRKPAASPAPVDVNELASGESQAALPPADEKQAGSFDAEAWDKARDERVKASKKAGNKHLDQVSPSVETMRGKEIYYTHDPKQRGVIRTVDNRGNVYVYWADEYSASRESASEAIEDNKAWLKESKGLPYLRTVRDGKTYVMESSLGTTDLKDYVFSDGAKSVAEDEAQAVDQPTATRTIAESIEQGKTGVIVQGNPDQLAEIARYFFTKGVVQRKTGITIAGKDILAKVQEVIPLREEDYTLADLAPRYRDVTVVTHGDGKMSIRSNVEQGGSYASVAEALAKYRANYKDAEASPLDAIAERVSDEAPKVGDTIQHDGDTWKIVGIGAKREDGKVYMHLASTTRGTQQKNGFNPAQIADWIDPTGENADAIATESTAAHVEPNGAEPATPAVVTENLAKAAKRTDATPAEMKAWLLNELDQAIAAAPDERPGGEGINDEGRYVTFDVPGDGKFKVLNFKARLQAFRKEVEKSSGFKKPAKGGPKRPGAPGSTAEATIREMLDDGELIAAKELADVTGKPFVFGRPDKADHPLAYTNTEKSEFKGIQFAAGRLWISPNNTDNGAWVAIELSTGLKIGDGSTQTAAIQNAEERLEANFDKIEGAIKRFGLKPQEELAREWETWAEGYEKQWDANRAAAEKAEAEKREAELKGPAPKETPETEWKRSIVAGLGRYTKVAYTPDARKVVAEVSEVAPDWYSGEIKIDGKIQERFGHGYGNSINAVEAKEHADKRLAELTKASVGYPFFLNNKLHDADGNELPKDWEGVARSDSGKIFFDLRNENGERAYYPLKAKTYDEAVKEAEAARKPKEVTAARKEPTEAEKARESFSDTGDGGLSATVRSEDGTVSDIAASPVTTLPQLKDRVARKLQLLGDNAVTRTWLTEFLNEWHRRTKGRIPYGPDVVSWDVAEVMREAAIPEGYKKVTEYYREGVLTDGYAPFAEGERVRLKNGGGLAGVVESYIGAGPVFPRAFVRFDNGSSAGVNWNEVEAEPSADNSQKSEGSAVREPWEMTYDEYLNTFDAEGREWEGNRATEHRASVQKAVNDGKLSPDSASMMGYPDIASEARRKAAPDKLAKIVDAARGVSAEAIDNSANNIIKSAAPELKKLFGEKELSRKEIGVVMDRFGEILRPFDLAMQVGPDYNPNGQVEYFDTIRDKVAAVIENTYREVLYAPTQSVAPNSTSAEPVAETAKSEQDDANTFTEAEALKRMGRVDGGTSGGIKTYAIEFYDSDANVDTGRGGARHAYIEQSVGRGGDKKFRVYTRGGDYLGDVGPLDNLREATEAAKKASLDSVRGDGYIRDAGTTEDSIGWDAMEYDERAALAVKAGWSAGQDNHLSTIGKTVALRDWKDTPEHTRKTLIAFATTGKGQNYEAAPNVLTGADAMHQALRKLGYRTSELDKRGVRIEMNRDDPFPANRYDVDIELKSGRWFVPGYAVPELKSENQREAYRKLVADMEALNAGRWPESVSPVSSGEPAESVDEQARLWNALPEKERVFFVRGVSNRETAFAMRGEWGSLTDAQRETAKRILDNNATLVRALTSDVVSADEYPTDEVAESYRHISHHPGDAAKIDRNAFLTTIQSEYDNALPVAETDEQKAVLRDEIEALKAEYMKREAASLGSRGNAYSAKIAGRGNLDSKGVARRNAALDRATTKFSDWVNGVGGGVKEAVLAARNDDQRAAEQQAKDEKAAKRREAEKTHVARLLNFQKGDGSKFGSYPIARVTMDRDGYPSSVTVEANDLTDNKFDIAKTLFDGDKERLRALVDEIRRDATETAEAAPAADADRIMTLKEHDALWDRIGKGETPVTADEARAAFERLVRDETAVKGELQKLKNADLERIARPNHRGEKKDWLVDTAYERMVTDFVFLASDGSGLVSISGIGRAARTADVRRKIANLTDEQVAAYGQRQRDAIAARAERIEGAKQAIADPKMLDDFTLYLRAKMADGMPFGEARMTLTPEQRATFDELAGEKTRDERRARADQQKAEVKVAAQTTDGQVIETKHTKTGEPLFVVKAAERVERDVYNQWNATAKRLGGWYSSYRGGGAVPGFQFKTRENADAFLAFLGGNVEQAKEAIQERRDAFADDRSQSAVERLTEMADRLDEKADESLGRERKANTERRARFAASAEAAANSEKALAATMRNIAGAIRSGTAKFLDRVRQKAQVELLQDFVRSAKYDEARTKFPDDFDRKQRYAEPATGETADYATWPQYTAYRSDLATLGRRLLDTEGTKKLGQQIMKVADDVSDAYLAFAKANLFEVSRFSVQGGARPTFTGREYAERTIARSGFKGKAIPFQVKRGEYTVIMSPSAAIEQGIWTGDGDKKITLSPDLGAEIVEKLGKLNRNSKFNRATADRNPEAPWQFETAYDRRKKLAAMGIETPSEFRAALREFIGLRETAKAPDRVKEMERAMIGRRNDGLDFFPTPASVAQEMVDAAEVKEGMSVLEPSAGMGHIAEVVRDAGVEPDVVEMANDRRELLEAKGFNVVGRDFMDMADAQYDRVLMNPPFSDRRDAEHVQHAYSLLKPGGRLVAIMGEGVFFGQDKKAQAFRDWLDEVGGTDEKLPEGTFMDPSLPVNTTTNARMIVVDKPEGMASEGSGAGTSVQAMRSDLTRELGAEAVEALLNSGKLRLHDAPLPGMRPRAKAFFDGTTLHLIASNMPAGTTWAALQHEGLHKWLSGLDGTPQFANLMNRLSKLYDLAGKTDGSVSKWFQAAYERINTADRAVPWRRNHELAAYAVEAWETAPRSLPMTVAKWVQDFIAAVKTWLADQLGFEMKRLTAADLAAISRRYLKELAGEGGPGPRGGLEYASESDGDSMRGMADRDSVASNQAPTSAGDGTTGGAKPGMPEFDRWFANSKVADEDGKPLVVYHGTNAKFDAFDFARGGSVWNDEASKAGVFFSVGKEDAEHYGSVAASRNGGSKRISRAYLSIQRMKVIDDTEGERQIARWLDDLRDSNPDEYYLQVSTKQYANSGGIGKGLELAVLEAKARGYDGAVVRMEGSPEWYVAFRPEQIRLINEPSAPAGSGVTSRQFSSESAQTGLDFAAEFLNELSFEDDAFRYPISDAKTIEGNIKSAMPGAEHIGREPVPEEDLKEYPADTRPDYKEAFYNANGRKFYVYANRNKVWIDVSNFLEGDGGGAIYHAIGNYAYNTNRVFVGDPLGLAEAAVDRRTQGMLSSALRFGTTRHLAPAKEQLDGIPHKGIEPLVWNYGNDIANVKALIHTSLESLQQRFPQINDYSYDFAQHRFIDSRGRPVDAARLERGARSPVARASHAGEASLRRGILLASLVSAESNQRPGILEQVLSRSLQLTSEQGQLGGLFSEAAEPSLVDRTLDLAARFTGPSAKTFGRLKGVITQLHKARIDPEHFGPVFKLAMAFRNDLSRSAYRGWEKAQDILPAYNDLKSAWNAVRHGKAADEAITRAGTFVFDGTMYGGGSPLAGIRWTAEQLRDQYDASDEEIRLYEQARAAIDASLDEVANSVAWKLAKPHVSAAMKEAIIGNQEEARSLLREALQLAEQAARDEVGTKDPEQAQAKADAIAATAAKVEETYAQADRLKAAGYAPLSRFGRYTVDVFEVGPDGQIAREANGQQKRLEFQKFEYEAEAREAEARLRKEYADQPNVVIQRGVQAEQKLFSGVDPETVALFAEQVADIPGLDVNREVLDAWRREAVSQRSALAHRIKRKGISGFSEDLPRVLATFLTSNARYAASNFHMGDMLERINAIPQTKGDVIDEAKGLYDYINGSNEPGAWMRGLMFAWYLGGSPAAAIVNLSQPALMAFPYLSQFGSAAKYLIGSAREAMNPDRVPAGLRMALNRAMEEGIVDAQEIHHLYDEGMRPIISRLPGGEDFRARAQGVSTLWGAFFGMAENFNRRITFLSAYKMAQDMDEAELRAKGFADAYDFAKRAVEETQGIYAKENRPSWARGSGPFGAVGVAAFTFRQYSIQYVELLTRMWRSGPEGKKAAGLMIGLLVLASGMQGIPGADDLDDLIDTLLQSLGYKGNAKKAKRDALANLAGERMADLVMYGLSAETPIDVQARLGLGNLLPATALFKPSEQGKAGQIAEIFGPPGGMAKSVGEFIGAVQSGKRGDAFAALAPVFIKNVAKAYQMADTGEYKDSRGRKVADVDLVDAAIKGIGFQPQSVAAPSRKARMVQQDIARVRGVEANIAALWAQANVENDAALRQRAKAMLDDWNQTNPETPIRINPAQIARRMQEMRKEREARLEKTAPKEIRGYVKESLR